ncbi:MAG: LuxR C-terminal-related transcriptional regulator [Acidimicrobiia bacterium]
MDAALVGRDTELDALTTSIEKGPGAVLTGPAGIGKTRLALEAANGSKRQVWWMAVTADSEFIPYGAFHHLVPELGEALASEGPATAFSVIRRKLTEGPSPRLLVVDDAHQLDQSSAAAVHAIANGGETKVVATIRDGEPVTGAITALWKDVGLKRMEIRPLQRADADALALFLLGGAADGRTLASIWRMSQGHPMELREVVLAGQESGTLVQVDDVWTIGGSFQATSRLVELVEDRLGRLDEEERFTAEALAYGEPLDIQLLATVSEPDVIERLERANVIRVFTTGASVTHATLAHPLYGEVLRATLPATRRSVLASALAQATAQDGAHRPDPLRVATWRLESGSASAEELEAAAISAVRRMAWDVALRFGTASLELAPSYMAHGCVAAALAELGDPQQAESHLLAARDLVSDPAMLAWNTISLADVWFYHAGRMEDALELVRKEVTRNTDPEIREEVMSALAINLMMYGNIQEVTELSRDVLESAEPSSSARLMALVASTSVDGLRLRPGEVRSAVEVAVPLIEENRHRFANAEDILHIALCVADLAAGDLGAARATVEERLRLALENDSGDLPGMWTLYSGLVLLYEGAAQRSYETQLEAQLLLDRYDSWLSKPLALVGAAHAAAVMANASAARQQIGGLAVEMRQTPRIRSRVAHVEALLASIEEGLSAGATAAVAAGDRAAEDDNSLWAVEGWHLAVRLGRPELVVGRLADSVAERPGTVASLYNAHAQALMAQDTVALERVAQDFNQGGFRLFAAEAASQMCGIHRRRNQANRARRAAVLAGELLPEHSGVLTPPFAELADVVPLTRREREVALLAARGMTSKDIADRLYISVRSVDNHLSRVYTKLGVTGRSELSTVLMAEG